MQPPPNKSLDASGGSVFLNLIRRRCVIECAPPRQLNRWAAAVNACGDGVSDMKRILLMLTFCLAIECLSAEQALAQQIPPTARSIEAFRRIEPQMSMKQVVGICGVPDEDIGSGIHIYVYKLSDGSRVRIGTPDKKRLIYVVHVLPNGEARSIIKIAERKDKRKRRVPSKRRPTNRWTGARIASSST